MLVTSFDALKDQIFPDTHILGAWKRQGRDADDRAKDNRERERRTPARTVWTELARPESVCIDVRRASGTNR